MTALDGPVGETYAQLRAPMATQKLQGFDYITGEQAITRLNEALGPFSWSFVIVERFIQDDELIVCAELQVPGSDGLPQRHQQFGSAQIKRGRNSGDPVDLGNDWKAAATDALKKCATHVGVGLWLSDKSTARETAATSKARPAQQQPVGKSAEAAAAASKPQPITCRECGAELPETILLGDRQLLRHQFANEGQKRFGRPLCGKHFKAAHDAATAGL